MYFFYKDTHIDIFCDFIGDIDNIRDIVLVLVRAGVYLILIVHWILVSVLLSFSCINLKLYILYFMRPDSGRDIYLLLT